MHELQSVAAKTALDCDPLLCISNLVHTANARTVWVEEDESLISKGSLLMTKSVCSAHLMRLKPQT